MEINDDAGIDGPVLKLSALPNDPEDAVREVVGAFTDAVEMKWLGCFDTGGAASLDDVDQAREMMLIVDLEGVDDPQEVIEALNGAVIGTYEASIALSDRRDALLAVEISLSLEDVEEEEGFVDDFGDDTDPEIHFIATFRADMDVL